MSPKQQKRTEEEETWKLRDTYEKILPVLDLMQATQINVSRTTDTQTAHISVMSLGDNTATQKYISLVLQTKTCGLFII